MCIILCTQDVAGPSARGNFWHAAGAWGHRDVDVTWRCGYGLRDMTVGTTVIFYFVYLFWLRWVFAAAWGLA